MFLNVVEDVGALLSLHWGTGGTCNPDHDLHSIASLKLVLIVPRPLWSHVVEIQPWCLVAIESHYAVLSMYTPLISLLHHELCDSYPDQEHLMSTSW